MRRADGVPWWVTTADSSSDDEDKDPDAIPMVADFFRAMRQKHTRSRKLAEVKMIATKWGLSGLGLTTVAIAAQIHLLGVTSAWSHFGQWWVLIPMVFALIPFAWIVVVALIEVAAATLHFLLHLPVYHLPAMLFGDDAADRFLAFVKEKVLPATFVLFLAWCTWQIGVSTVLGPTQPTQDESWDFSWFFNAVRWITENPIATVLILPIVIGLLKTFGSQLAEFVGSFFAEESGRCVTIYGPDGREVSRVQVKQ